MQMMNEQTGIPFILNGRPVRSLSAPGTRLLEVLRDEFHLTGTKCGCKEGECGACSVLINGRLVTSCLIAVGSIAQQAVLTIEGYRETERFAVLDAAFADMAAVQCGFCTPGMVLATEALLSEHPHPSAEEIRQGLSGNLCRCTGYQALIQAVRTAAQRGAGLW